MGVLFESVMRTAESSRDIAAHARVARATRTLSRARRAAIAPALLHLACVRLAGPDGDLERRAYTFWERTLEGLGARRRVSRRGAGPVAP